MFGIDSYRKKLDDTKKKIEKIASPVLKISGNSRRNYSNKSPIKSITQEEKKNIDPSIVNEEPRKIEDLKLLSPKQTNPEYVQSKKSIENERKEEKSQSFLHKQSLSAIQKIKNKQINKDQKIISSNKDDKIINISSPSKSESKEVSKQLRKKLNDEIVKPDIEKKSEKISSKILLEPVSKLEESKTRNQKTQDLLNNNRSEDIKVI